MKKIVFTFAIYLIFAFLGVPQTVYAQGAALVTPPVTTGHCAQWTAPNLLSDSGAACGSGGGGGSGTVTNVTAGTGLTGAPNPITSAGTIALDTTRTFTSGANGLTPASGGGTTNFLRADGTWTTPTGSGTVTSVGSGFGLTGGPVTTTGTIAVNSSVIPGITLNNIFTNYNQITAGTATCNCDFIGFEPSNYGVGNPGLFLQKDSTANSWTLGLYDTSTYNGKITLSAQNVFVPGNVSITGTATVNGSPVCTASTGCGGAGGGYATIYPITAYGGDPTGAADNTAAFNAALSACSSGTGGIIWFQGGTFKFTSTIIDNIEGCSIAGVGPKGTVLKPTGISGDFLTFTSTSVQANSISDLQILNGGSWTSGYALNVQGSWPLVTDVWISGTPKGIHNNNGADGRFERVLINDVTSSPAVLCDGTVFGSRWHNVTVTYFSGNTTAIAFEQGNACNTLVLDTVDTTVGATCLQVDSGSSFTVLNDFECDHSQFGVQVQGGTGIQIENSWFGSTYNGPGITFTSGFSGFASIGTTHIRDNNAYGVLMNGSGGIQIVNNVISGNTTAQVAAGAGVGHFQVNSNQLGVSGDAGTTDGVLINSGSSDYYTVTANLIYGASTGVADGGSGSHKSVTGNAGP